MAYQNLREFIRVLDKAGELKRIRQEVDPILEKISAHGLDSLTDKERKILEAARQRMGSNRSR